MNGDALLDHFEAEYDFVFSRFGTMFFANPVAGLRSMRTALKPGARSGSMRSGPRSSFEVRKITGRSDFWRNLRSVYQNKRH